MSPTLRAFKAVLGVQTDPGEGLSLSRWAGTHAELEGWPRASACLRVTSEPQAEVPCGHRPPVLCGDWEGRRARPPASSRRVSSGTRLPHDVGQPVPLAGCDITDDRRSPRPRQAHRQAPLFSPGIPQGPCPVEGSLGGQVLCPQAVLSSGSSGPQRLAEPAGTSTRPSGMPGGSPHPAQPQPPSTPGYWHTAASSQRGPGATGSISALSLSAWPGPSTSPALHLLVCDKGAATRCSPPRIRPGEEAYRVPSHCGARGTAAPTANPPCDFQATDGHSGACGLSSDSWPTRQGSGLGLGGHSCGQAPGQEAPSRQQELPCRPK